MAREQLHRTGALQKVGSYPHRPQQLILLVIFLSLRRFPTCLNSSPRPWDDQGQPLQAHGPCRWAGRASGGHEPRRPARRTAGQRGSRTPPFVARAGRRGEHLPPQVQGFGPRVVVHLRTTGPHSPVQPSGPPQELVFPCRMAGRFFCPARPCRTQLGRSARLLVGRGPRPPSQLKTDTVDPTRKGRSSTAADTETPTRLVDRLGLEIVRTGKREVAHHLERTCSLGRGRPGRTVCPT